MESISHKINNIHLFCDYSSWWQVSQILSWPCQSQEVVCCYHALVTVHGSSTQPPEIVCCYHALVTVAESPIHRSANLHKVTSLNVSYLKIKKAYLLGDKVGICTHCAFRCPIITKMVLHNHRIFILTAGRAWKSFPFWDKSTPVPNHAPHHPSRVSEGAP